MLHDFPFHSGLSGLPILFEYPVFLASSKTQLGTISHSYLLWPNIFSDLLLCTKRRSFVTLKPEHAEQVAQLERICFPGTPSDALFAPTDLVYHATLFPEGSFVALDGERVAGFGAGIFRDVDFEHAQHTFDEVIGDNRYAAHTPDGDYYYGTDIIVHPDYRRRGIGKRLYELRKELVIHYNKKGIVAGGVLPHFAHHKDRLSALEYVTQVAAGQLYDPTLSFQIENGFEVRGVLENYFLDERSDNWASFIVWENPHYTP